jgi:hypothetical protein
MDEPVAWMKVWRDGTKNFYDYEPPMFGKHKTYALYTAPREWVGLTDDEENEIAEDWWKDRLPDIHSVIKAIEAKLREKNYG